MFLLLSPAIFAEEIRALIMEIDPFGMIKNDRPEGLYYDIAVEVIKKAGYVPNVQVVPFARAHLEVIKGSADFTIMFSTSELDEKTIRSREIFYFANLLIPQKGIVLKKIKDAEKFSIGRLRAGCSDLLDQKKLNLNLAEFNSYDQGLLQLVNKRLDILCGSIIPVSYSMKKMNMKFSQFGEPLVLSKRKTYFHFSKKLDTNKRIKLMKAIDQLIESSYFSHEIKKAL